MMHAKPETLRNVCDLLTAERPEDAQETIRNSYPFVPVAPSERKYGEVESLRIFLRDGFIDRYSGERLVFPGTLRLLSMQLPDVFPYQSNWKMSETHMAFWELTPTVDHVVPVARGGKDDESNWVTTSMLRNSAKANWTLEELGWECRPIERSADWDGLLPWFVAYVGSHPDVLANDRIRSWSRAARQCGAG
jgi:5-methylcytosine-specific restriction endonuclease McrA